MLCFLFTLDRLKADSHYCVFRVRLRQTVAFLQGDRKFPISALTQPTAETQTAASSVNQPLLKSYFRVIRISLVTMDLMILRKLFLQI